MSKFLTDTWNEAANEMKDFFADMDAKIEKAQAVVQEAETEAKIYALEVKNAELLAALEAITERAEDVSEKIPVENRSEGVSQAAHVRHMASHLAQHAKIARAAIQKAKG